MDDTMKFFASLYYLHILDRRQTYFTMGDDELCWPFPDSFNKESQVLLPLQFNSNESVKS